MSQQTGQVAQAMEDLKRAFARLIERQELMLKYLDGRMAFWRFAIGDYLNEQGDNLEEFTAAGLRYGLQDPSISADQIRLRQALIDTEGAVFPAGFAIEVDLIVRNGKLTVFEVMDRYKNSEVDIFSLKVRLVQAQHPDQEVRGVLIAVGARDAIQKRAAGYGLELVR